MRIIVFSLVFLLLVAASTLADGLKITRVDARVDYDNAYVYRLEQQERLTLVNYASVPLTGDSRVNVDLFPGSNLTFTITLENTFLQDTPEIRNIFAKITIQGKGRNGQDLEETSTNFNLEPGNEVKLDIKFYIPFNVDSGPHNILIKVGGIGNHTSFETNLNSLIDIKKIGHDLRITKVSLEPSALSCTRKATLTAEIANAGSNNEDDVALEFKIPSLGFDSYDKGISLSASNEDPDKITHVKTAKIEVPAFFEAGKYPIFINLYWKNFVVFDQRIIELNVKNCGSGSVKSTSEQGSNESSVTVIQPAETQNPPEGTVTSIESSSILNSPILLPILFGNGFVIIALAALVVFGFLKRSRV